MNTYQQFAEYLGKKNERPLANNTRVRLVEPGKIAIRLHSTNIVTIDEFNNVTLNSGGWRTSTTKARINEFSPVQISQCKGVWTVSKYLSNGQHKTLGQFADGFTYHADGTVTGAAPASQQDEEKKLRNRIKKFAGLCAQTFPLPHPGAGDCFYCQMREVETGKPLGDVTKNTDHLVAHLDENYIVPSLVWNALEAAGYHPGRQIAHAAVFNAGMENMASFAKGAVTRSVRKYLYRQFGLA